MVGKSAFQYMEKHRNSPYYDFREYELRDYIERGKNPEDAIIIFHLGLAYIIQNVFGKSLVFTYYEGKKGKSMENVNIGMFAKKLVNEGYSERNFKIFIQESLEGAFVNTKIGTILPWNGIGQILDGDCDEFGNPIGGYRIWELHSECWDDVIEDIEDLPHGMYSDWDCV